MRVLCKKNQAELVVVGLGNQPQTISNEYYYVNAETALIDYSKKTGVDYGKLYSHYAKDDTLPFDQHPNHRAHEVIADTLTKYIQTIHLVETEFH